MKRTELSAITTIAAFAFALAACGQPLTTAEQTQTAQAVVSPASSTTATPAVAATPDATLAAAAQPTPPSPPQILAEAAGVFVTPAAVGAADARTDCPADWVTYADLSKLISVCAPGGAVVVADITARGEPGITLASDVAGKFSKDVPRFAVVIRLTPESVIPLDTDLSTYCRTETPDATAVTLDTGGVTASGCSETVEIDSSDGPLQTLRLAARLAAPPLAGLNFVGLIVNWRVQSAGAETMAQEIASSVRVGP